MLSKASDKVQILTAKLLRASAEDNCNKTCALWFYQQEMPEKLKSLKRYR